MESRTASTSAPAATENPYQTLISSCNDGPLSVQQFYQTHRQNRSQAQVQKFLSSEFSGVEIDPVLYSLVHDSPTGYKDPRNCLVFWARPTRAMRELVKEIQGRLKEVVPELYCPKAEDLHMTALEITHSRTAEEIDQLVEQLLPQAEKMVNLPRQKAGVKLCKPMVSFDAQALALSFLPAGAATDVYGYHHLRRDLWNLAREKVKVASRYVVPSAHVTVGRYLSTEVDAAKLVKAVEVINAWLEEQYEGEKGEWTVGSEVGLHFRKGALWYGDGGESVLIGKGL